jgi:hypothetical protein
MAVMPHLRAPNSADMNDMTSPFPPFFQTRKCLGTRINYKSCLLAFLTFHNLSTFFRFSETGHDDFWKQAMMISGSVRLSKNAMTNLCPFARFARNYTTILVVDVMNVEQKIQQDIPCLVFGFYLNRGHLNTVEIKHTTYYLMCLQRRRSPN